MKNSDEFFYCKVTLNLAVPSGIYLPDWRGDGTDEQTIVMHNLVRFIMTIMNDVDINVQHISLSDIWKGPSLAKRN